MKFDLQEYRTKVLENGGIKSERLLKFESLYGLLPNSIEECVFYTEYVSKFEHNINYLIRLEHKSEFNWHLLLQLIAASFANELSFEITPGGEIESVITIVTSEEVMIRKISELLDYQLVKLITTYVNEQIKNYVTKELNEIGKNAVLGQQTKMLLQFQNETLVRLKRDLKVNEIIRNYRKKG